MTEAESQHSIAQIARTINGVDAGIAGLIELLDLSNGTLSTESFAALLRPHAQNLARASAALNDHA